MVKRMELDQERTRVGTPSHGNMGREHRELKEGLCGRERTGRDGLYGLVCF